MKKLSVFLLSLIFVFAMSCNNEETGEETTENGTENGTVNEAVTFNSVDEMIDAAKADVEFISAADIKAKIDAEDEYLLIDVRSQQEYKKGYILTSVNIPRGVLEFRMKKESFWEDEMLYMPESNELIIIYCKSGKRAILAAATLKSMGYTNVKTMTEGFNDFKETYAESVEIPVVEEGDMPAEGGSEDEGGC
jgi:rhodanese-related sulfurtransferase